MVEWNNVEPAMATPASSAGALGDFGNWLGGPHVGGDGWHHAGQVLAEGPICRACMTLDSGESVWVEGPAGSQMKRLLRAVAQLGIRSTTDLARGQTTVCVLVSKAHALASRVLTRRGLDPVPLYVLGDEAEDPVLSELEVLSAGADAYWEPSLCPDVLSSRVRAALRFFTKANSEDRCRRVSLCNSDRSLKVGNRTFRMSRREFDVLACLSTQHGDWIPSRMLHQKVFGPSRAYDSSLVRTHVWNIRRKLGPEAWVLRSDRELGVMLMRDRSEALG